MSKFPTGQTATNKLPFPSKFWIQYKPKAVVDQVTQELKKPRFIISNGKGFDEVDEVEFMCGSCAYVCRGESIEGRRPGTTYFTDFKNGQLTFFGPDRKPHQTNFRELKDSPVWMGLKLKLMCHYWGVLRYIDPATGEYFSVPAVFEITNSFEQFNQGDTGQLRLFKAGAGELTSFGETSFRLMGIEDAKSTDDGHTDKLFDDVCKDFVLYFRQHMPDYLAEHFDEEGQIKVFGR